MKPKSPYIVILILALFCAIKAQGQSFTTKGTDFWFGFMENYLGDDTTGSDKMKVYITADDLPATGTVSVPKMGWSKSYTVSANSTVEIVIPTDTAMCTTSEVVEGKGVHVVSDNPVSVYQLNFVEYTSDANIVLPALSLGTKYRAVTYMQSPAAMGWTEVSTSLFMVVAAFDSTYIKITPRCNTEGLHGAGVPFTIMLNQGEVYQVRAYYSLSYNLSGSLIELDTTYSNNCKTFAVFAGNKCVFIPGDTCCCNHICEEMMPVNTWGKKYITVPLVTRLADAYRIVGSQNNTIYTINGGMPQGVNAGQTVDIFSIGAPSYIESNKPIAVAQFSKSMQTDMSESDPFMIMINPLEQMIKRVVFNSFTSLVITSYYVNIVTKTANAFLVNLDGINIGSSFNIVGSNPLYSYAQMSIAQGNHILSSDSGFIANVYGYGNYESYGYIAGAMVKNLDIYYSIVSPTDSMAYFDFTDTVCRGTPLTFVAMNNPSIVAHYWDFGDGSPVATGPVVTHSYPDAGTYTMTYYYERNNACIRDSIVWFITTQCCNTHPIVSCDSTLCIGDTATISETSFLNPNATYTWDFGSGNMLSGTGQGPYSVIYNTVGTDTVWVWVTEPTCPDDSAYSVIETKPIPTSTFTVYSPLCYGESTIALYTGDASPSATYYWNWNGGNVISGTGQGPYYLYWLTPGTFNVSLDVYENGCPSLTTYVPVTIYMPAYPNFVADPQITFIEEPTIDFIDYSTNTATWSWNFGDPISGASNYSSQSSPTHTYTLPGTYTVWLYVVSPDSCVDSISQDIRILDTYDYFIANAFTPNEDGVNETFEPFSSSEWNYTLSIYDRWGEQIFVGENMGWDGKFKGEVVKSDVYAWTLLYQFKDYQMHIAYGHVTVLP